jgi:hypothetical protein
VAVEPTEEEVKPITPDEVIERRVLDVPEWVIAVWNDLLEKNYLAGQSSFTLAELKDALMTRWNEEDPIDPRKIVEELKRRLPAHMPIVPSQLAQSAIDAAPRERRKQLEKNGWCDLEHLYRKAGWDVEFDRATHLDADAKFSFRFQRSTTWPLGWPR